MFLLELRYNKTALVDKIMTIIDEVQMGGNDFAAEKLQRSGIDINRDVDELRREMLMADEYKLARLVRSLMGNQ